MVRKAVALGNRIVWSLVATLLLPVSPVRAAESPLGVGIIDTFVGVVDIRDGGRATEAQFRFPYGMTVDGAGNLYIADNGDNRVRKVDATGTISTIAGTGEPGFSGDGGPATEAQLNFPCGVAVDGAGNLYIADRFNNRVRKVDSTGRITTVAGTGNRGFSGDEGPATDAQLYHLQDVAVDGAGNLYIADRSNSRIRKVDTTGTITTVAGTGERGFSGDGGPATDAQLLGAAGVAVDGAGNLYIADTSNHRVRKVDTTGTISTIAGTGERGFSGDGGSATEAQINGPYGMAMDGADNLYFADFGNRRIRKVDATGVISTVAGTGDSGFAGDGGPATEAQLSGPFTVALDGTGSLYIGDGSNHRVRKVDATGTITTVAGTEDLEDGGPAIEARLDNPSGVVLDGTGNLYIVDRGNHRIRKVDTTGTISTIAGTGKPGFSGDGGPATEAQLNFPGGVAVDGAGNLYIVDRANSRVRKVDTAGTITTIAGTGERGFSEDGGPAIEADLNDPRATAVDGAGNLYIVDGGNHRVHKVDTTGTITTIAGTEERGFSGDGGPATEAQLNFPGGVAVDGAGNLYIVDGGNYRVRKVDTTGTITTIAGTGERGFSGDGGPATEAQLIFPSGVAVDRADNLYIVDGSGYRIRKVDATGTITTIAGTGESGFSGDGGPAIEAQLGFSTSAAVDGAGNLYIADSNNNRIRILVPARLDFAHFANGASIVSDLVFVNAGSDPIRPALTFYDSQGSRISADSVVDVTEDLMVQADGSLTVQTEMEPLSELTISTHGRGELTTGSVKTVAGGPFGGVLRFNAATVGVAGVGAGRPVHDALFPVRRQADGINTGTAIRNLAPEALVMTCHLMQDGEMLESAKIRLGAYGQRAQFIHEMFPGADTSDFTGSVRCTARESRRFTGVALEMDVAERIFTTLPLASPVADEGEAVSLHFAHFANGGSISSDLVLVNVSKTPATPAIFFYDTEGNPIAGDSVVEVTGDLEVTDDGALTVGTEISPLGEWTVSTTGAGMLQIGSARVDSNEPLGGVLRFNVPDVGVAGVGACDPVTAAVFPARRQMDGINTGAALRNLETEAMMLTCQLMQKGMILEETEIELAANGQTARFIDELFAQTDTSDFVGTVHCHAPDEGQFTGVALEMDARNRIFTTLPMIPVQQ